MRQLFVTIIALTMMTLSALVIVKILETAPESADPGGLTFVIGLGNLLGLVFAYMALGDGNGEHDTKDDTPEKSR